MFSSENVKSITLTIDSDPGGTNEMFYMYKAPRALTVLRAHMVSEQANGAGTATKLQLENWGTAGTSVKSGGTVVASLGGTATAAQLSARTPATQTATSSADDIAAGEWLVARYIEEGSGWVSGDRLFYQIDVVQGVGA